MKAAALALCLLLPAAAAGADATLVDDGRSLFVRNETCTSPCPIEATKTPLFPGAPFNDFISGALFNDWSSSQSSAFGPDGMNGVGFTDAFSSLGEGRSLFDVTFAISEAHTFDLTGEIEAEGNAAVLAQLSDEDLGIPLVIYTAGAYIGSPLNQVMDETGTLPPGEYRLTVEGVVVPNLQGGDADWAFVLALPEPAFGWQLLGGVAALAALGRLRRSQSARSVIQIT